MDEQQQNPEKIPLNPIQDSAADKQTYQSSQTEPISGRDQVIRGMFKQPKQEPTIPLKYRIFLAAMMILFVIVCVIVGKVLSRNGFI